MKYHFLAIIVLFNIFNILGSKIDTLEVRSNSMNKTIQNIIIIPDNYKSQGQGLSVLYLLHGAGGDHTNWTQKVSKIKAYADTYNIIIVCPDGAQTSWYLDSPEDDSMKYETYISKELIISVDTKYNTVKDKSGRAITGLSMGGHGAFYLAFKHQDTWGAAGSMSGGLDFRAFPNNWKLAQILGDYETHQENWEKHTVTNMIYLLEDTDLKLTFDCGVDDFFYEVNKTFHEKLLVNNIPHDYTERPGKHNWEYWENSIKYQILFFDDFFNK